MNRRWLKILIAFLLVAAFAYAEEKQAFDGLFLNLGNLNRLSWK